MRENQNIAHWSHWSEKTHRRMSLPNIPNSLIVQAEVWLLFVTKPFHPEEYIIWGVDGRMTSHFFEFERQSMTQISWQFISQVTSKSFFLFIPFFNILFFIFIPNCKPYKNTHSSVQSNLKWFMGFGLDTQTQSATPAPEHNWVKYFLEKHSYFYTLATSWHYSSIFVLALHECFIKILWKRKWSKTLIYAKG